MKDRQKILVYATTIIGCLIILAPLFWMLVTSFKTFGETLQVDGPLLPQNPTLDNYKQVVETLPMGQLTLNTVVVMFFSIIGSVLNCSLAAFALVYLKIPGVKYILIFILSFAMIPGEVFTIPVYNIMNQLGLINTLTAIVIPKSLYTLGVLLMYQAFKTIPSSIIESARLDGASWLRVYARVAMPLAKSSIVSLSILVALFVWKELLWVIVVNHDLDKMTLGPGIARLGGSAFTEYNLMMAADVLAIIPMLIIFLVLQKQFMKTAIDSSVK